MDSHPLTSGVSAHIGATKDIPIIIIFLALRAGIPFLTRWSENMDDNIPPIALKKNGTPPMYWIMSKVACWLSPWASPMLLR